MTPAAIMREAHLRLAAAVQPAIAAALRADVPSGEGASIEPGPVGVTPREPIAPVWHRTTDEERAWCARMRAAMTQPPGNERSRGR
jgi:hypothetical protein